VEPREDQVKNNIFHFLKYENTFFLGKFQVQNKSFKRFEKGNLDKEFGFGDVGVDLLCRPR
jgi:hypothetical protein